MDGSYFSFSNAAEDVANTKRKLAVRKKRKKVFGKYIVHEELGRGGMGAVYKVYDIQLRKVVALKVILDKALQHGRRFEIESAAMARLNNRYMVKIYEYGRKPKPYIAMEYLHGVTLERLIAEKSLSYKKIIDILIKICSCLEEIHKLDIIHRDIKPENIMIAKNGDPKLMDFGLAKFMQLKLGISQAGMILGTTSYMAPEQVNGRAEKRSDIYALGATMYELFTGKKLFDGGSNHAILLKVIKEKPISPRKINPHIPKEVERICLKCVRKDPAHRYKDFGDVINDLKKIHVGKKILPLLQLTIVFAAVVMSCVFVYFRFPSSGSVGQPIYRAMDFIREQKPQRAMIIFRKIVADSNANNFDKSQAYVQMAILSHRGSKSYFLKKALELNTNNHEALYHRAILNKSIIDIDRAILLSPNNAKYYATKAGLHLSRKEYTKVEENLSKAQRLDTEIPRIYNYRGYMYYFLHKYDLAIAQFSLAIAKAPQYTDAYLGRGFCYQVIKNFPKALRDYAVVLKFGSILERNVARKRMKDIKS